ncbi:hypothetical protein ACFFRR_007953 [Megaselia abdita]
MKDKKRSNRRTSKTFKERKDGQYYTIESTEEIYSTTLSAKQRNYIDPWDLENYDYVRKKLASPVMEPEMLVPMSPKPDYYYMSNSLEDEDYPTIIENNRAYSSRYYSGGEDEEELTSRYMSYPDRDYDMDSQLDQPIYGVRDEHSIYGTSRRLSTIQRRQPKVDFPPPPPNPAYITSDDISPYHDTGYRSISDYYGSGHSSLSPPASYHPSPNMIYGSSMYGAINGSGGSGGPVDSIYDTSRKTSSIYSYGNIGLSKKGLLQIDYSCSWDDLDRMIGRTIYE